MTLLRQLADATDREHRSHLLALWLGEKLRQRSESDLAALLQSMLHELDEALAAYGKREQEIERLRERLDRQKERILRHDLLKKIVGREAEIFNHVNPS